MWWGGRNGSSVDSKSLHVAAMTPKCLLVRSRWWRNLKPIGDAMPNILEVNEQSRRTLTRVLLAVALLARTAVPCIASAQTARVIDLAPPIAKSTTTFASALNVVEQRLDSAHHFSAITRW